MRKILMLLAVALLATTVQAQTFPDGNVVYLSGTADPVGSCIVGTEFYRTDTADRFTCGDGSWSAYGGGATYDGGSVTNPFLAPTGCGSTPGYAFDGDPDTGFCHLTAEEVGLVRGGTLNTRIYKTGNFGEWELYSGYTDSSNLIGLRIQSVSTGGIALEALASGTFAATTQNININPINTGRMIVGGTGDASVTNDFSVGGISQFAAGSQAARSIQNVSDASDGIHFPAANQATFGTFESTGSYTAEFRASSSGSVGKATVYAADGGNAAQLDVYTTYLQASQEMLFPVGSGSAPSITFAGDLDAGMFHAGTDEVRLVVNNAEDYIGVSDSSAYLFSKETTGDDTASVTAQAGTEQVNIATSDNGAAGGTAQVLVTSSQDYVYITANNATEWGEVFVRATGFDIADSGTQPSCTSATRGTLSKEDNASGVDDTFEVCAKTTDDSYTWVPSTDGFPQTGTSTLTETTATNLVLIPIPFDGRVAGSIDVDTYCADASDWVVRRVSHHFVCKSVSGTEDCSFNTGDPASNGTSGSLSAHTMGSAAVGSNAVYITLNATCSLTQTTFESTWRVTFSPGFGKRAVEQN